MAPTKKKNSFYFFMREMQESEAAKGRRIAMKDMATYAHPIWQKMSVVEKEPYEELARKHKNDPTFRGPKLASDGTSVEDNLRERQAKERAENEMIQEIRNYVHYENPALFKEIVPKRLFYFISFNILCETETETIPIEVGVVEYSILDGILREHHMLIFSGRIPTGYTGEARRHSEDKHQIDIFSGEPSSEKDMRVVYESIKSFVNPHNSDISPPLFCLEEDIERTNACLKWLKKRAVDSEEFDVWKANYLLLELRAGLGDEFKLPGLILANELLTRTSFNYHPAARCSFHEEKDCHFCALAYSKRLCYLLSDAVCSVFEVAITEKHIPTRSVEDKEYVVVEPKDANHFNERSHFTSRHRLDQRDNYFENDVEDGQFEDDEPIQFPKPRQPRQPTSNCIAAEMSRLNLKSGIATAPGQGIGRGQRRQ